MPGKALFHHKLWLVAVILTLDGVFFCLTDPHKVTSVTLMIGYGLLVASVYLCLRQVLAVARLYGLPFSRHRRRIALFGTGVIATLVGLQSMGELSVRDLLVAVPLAIMLYIYVSLSRARAAA